MACSLNTTIHHVARLHPLQFSQGVAPAGDDFSRYRNRCIATGGTQNLFSIIADRFEKHLNFFALQLLKIIGS